LPISSTQFEGVFDEMDNVFFVILFFSLHQHAYWTFYSSFIV
jgi:hypothetical protein